MFIGQSIQNYEDWRDRQYDTDNPDREYEGFDTWDDEYFGVDDHDDEPEEQWQ